MKMKAVKVDLKKCTKEGIDLISGYFKSGKVIVYPTDTVYGIGCIATDKKAINKIKKIKGRDKNKPMLVLVKSFCQLRKYCFVNKKQDKYLHDAWKKNTPITVILKHRNLLPKELTGKMDTLAVRLPKNDFLGKILKEVNLPIVSTSLNTSGDKILSRVDNLDKYFKNIKPDLVVDNGIISRKRSSKIFNVVDMDNVKRLR